MSDLPPNTRITAFLQAFASHWGVLVTGIASVPFTFFWLYFSNEAAKIVFSLLAVGCLFLASYFVWKDQRSAYLNELDRNTKPEIKCSITAAYIDMVIPSMTRGAQKPTREDSVVILELWLENARPVPTTIKDYELQIDAEDEEGKKTGIGRFVLFPAGPRTYTTKQIIPGEVQSVVEEPIEKIITPANPLEYGKHKVCWARFYVDGLRPVRDYPNARIRLGLKDGTGKWHNFDIRHPIKSGELLHL